MRLPILLALLATPLLAQIVPPNDMGVSMGHLHILTTDPDAHRKLWIDVLGGRPVKTGPIEWAVFPGVFVGFTKGEPSGGSDGSVVNHLGFLVRDLDGTRAKLTDAGLKVVRELPATHQFFAMFPDNVLVEFSGDPNSDSPIKHHHIHFASHQVDEMRAWYAKHFGAVPGMRARFKTADVPGVNLSWNAADAAPAPSAKRSVDHIGFEVKDIKAFCAKLEADGIKLDRAVTPVERLGLTIAFLTDPWGTRIELTEGFVKAQ
jgi:catechol 2,3-dioxygenase-like lactoylglutathione lyase family enzyme